MKKIMISFITLVIVFWAATSFAADLNGNYTFLSRAKNNQPDLVGWTGNMTIKDGVMVRNLVSPDGTTKKFYDTTLTDDGNDLYTLKITKAYKPEYVGQEHQNKITITATQMTIQASDDSFKEVWVKTTAAN